MRNPLRSLKGKPATQSLLCIIGVFGWLAAMVIWGEVVAMAGMIAVIGVILIAVLIGLIRDAIGEWRH